MVSRYATTKPLLIFYESTLMGPAKSNGTVILKGTPSNESRRGERRIEGTVPVTKMISANRTCGPHSSTSTDRA